MLTQDNHDKATAALLTLKKLIESNRSLTLVEKVQLSGSFKAITTALADGMIPPAPPPSLPTTEQVQPPALYEEVDETIAIDKLTREQQTEKIQKALEYIARGRSIISSFIRQEDKTIISINSPSAYNQPIINTFNNEQENLKMVLSTATLPYFVTLSPKTKYMTVSVSKHWKTPEAIAKANAKTKS
jgi:hypothetical protein